jgi:ferrous iron transport protein A
MLPGETGQVADIRGGRGAARRLTELGLVPGVRVRMVRGGGMHGSVIVKIGDAGTGETKIGIGRGMARRVLVRHSPEDGSE